MGSFSFRVRSVENFRPPDTLYHNTYALKHMATDIQRPAIIGDVVDLALFTSNRLNPRAEYPTPQYSRDMHEKVGDKREVDLKLFVQEGRRMLLTTAPSVDIRNKKITISNLFAHHAKLLTDIFSYEFQLCPELFGSKTVFVEERTVADLRKFGGSSEYTAIHVDYRPGPDALPEDSTEPFVRSLDHVYIASDCYGTGFVKDITKIAPDFEGKPLPSKFGSSFQLNEEDIYRVPDGKISFHNGAMLHFAALPKVSIDDSAPPMPRTALIVAFSITHGRTMSDFQHIFQRNTERQTAILSRNPLQSPRLISPDLCPM